MRSLIIQLYQFIHSALSNQLVGGGFLVMTFGGFVAWVVAFGRRLPKQGWNILTRRFTVKVDITNDDPLFSWVAYWLSVQPYSRRTRILTATTDRDDHGRSQPGPPVDTDGDREVPQIVFTPAPGNHILRYKGRFIWLSRERKEAPPGNESLSTAFSRFRQEVFTLTVIGRSQETARQLLEDARTLAFTRREKKVEIYVAGWDYWQSIGERDPRPLSSVFLPEGTVQTVVKDIQDFLSGKAWYVQRGIPWRRGFLFFGLPGSGKTSLICALSGYFKMNLYILSLSSERMSDDNLSMLLSRVPPKSLVLLEDVDSAFVKREKSDSVQNTLSFSGFLNALCGAGSKEGTIVFMTTNHKEVLDPALIRPGRADVHIEFGLATASQAEAMFRAFFPEVECVNNFGCAVERAGMTMAEVQRHLVSYRDSPVKALNIQERVGAAA